jgi:hypothetical protein
VIRPDIEMMQRELTRDDDFLVMASDGLWDVLRNKDVCDICYSLAGSQRHQQIAEELVHAALSRGSMDNVTCIVVKLTGYVSKQLVKENCENRLDTGSLDPSVVSANSPKSYHSNSISPSISPVTVHGLQGQQTQESAPPAAFSGQQMQRSLFSRGNENQSPEHIRNISNTNNIIHHPRAYANGVGSAKLTNHPSALSASRFENIGNGTNSYPSSSTKNSRNNQGVTQGVQGEEMGKGQTLSGGLWGMPGLDGSNFVTRPWTGPNPVIGQTMGQPGSGGPGQGIAMLQGRQSPSQQSGMAINDRIQSPNTYSQTQYHQHQIGPRRHSNKDDIGHYGDKASDVDIEVQPSSILMRPHPQRIQQMSVSSRFQQSPSQSNLFNNPNHDPRSGFASVKGPGGTGTGVKGGGAFNSNNRAASASSASVRNNQGMNSMPKLLSKTTSFDLFTQQLPATRGNESPYQHPDNNFSSIARNGTPPGLIANSSPVAGGIRPLNSPIGMFTS